MPAYANTFLIAARTWVCVTPTAVAALCLQSQGPYEVHMKVNQSATVAPLDTSGSKRLDPGVTLTTADLLNTLFASSVDGSGRGFVWIYTEARGSVSVDYNA